MAWNNNCNNILDESIRNHLKLTLSKFQASNIANSKLLESICDPKKNYTSFKPGSTMGAEVEMTFKTHTNEDSIYSINVCSEVQRLWLDYYETTSNMFHKIDPIVDIDEWKAFLIDERINDLAYILN